MLSIALEFYHAGRISLSHLLSTMTWRAAKIINFDGGILEIGKRADFTVIDLDHKWTVETEKFASRSKNSPFNGRKVRGRAVMTIVGGEVRFAV
jgi:dihydroorotase